MGKSKHRYSHGSASIVNEHEERRKMKESILKIFHQRAMSPDGAVLVNEISRRESYSKRKPATKDVHHDKAFVHHEKSADVILSSDSDAKSISEIKTRKRRRKHVPQENVSEKGFANAVSTGAHISRNRLTRRVGLFNTGKKSKTVYRDVLALSASVQKDVDRTMKKLLAKDDTDGNAWSPEAAESRPEQSDLDAELEPISRPGQLHGDAEQDHISRPGQLHMDAELKHISRPKWLHVDAELEHITRPRRLHMDAEQEHISRPGRLHVDAGLEHSRPGRLLMDAEREHISRPGQLHVDDEHISRPGRLHMDAEQEHISRPRRLHMDDEHISRPGWLHVDEEHVSRPGRLYIDAEQEHISRPGRLHVDDEHMSRPGRLHVNAELEHISRPGRLQVDAKLEHISRPGHLDLNAELEPVSRPVVSRVKPASTSFGHRNKGSNPVDSASDSTRNTDEQHTSDTPSSSDPDVLPKLVRQTTSEKDIRPSLASMLKSRRCPLVKLLTYFCPIWIHCTRHSLAAERPLAPDQKSQSVLPGLEGKASHERILCEPCVELNKLLLEKYMTPEGKLQAGAGSMKSRGGSSVRRSLLHSLAQSAATQKDCTRPGLCQSRPHSVEIVPSHKPVQTCRHHKQTLSFDTLFRPASPPTSYYFFSKSSFDPAQIGLPDDSVAQHSETCPSLRYQDRKLPGALQHQIRGFPGTSQQCDDRAGAEDMEAFYAYTTVPSHSSATTAVCLKQGPVSAGLNHGRRATSGYRNHCCNPTSYSGKAGLGVGLRATSACRSHCCNAGCHGGNAVSAGFSDVLSATSACKSHLCNTASQGGKAVSLMSPDPAALCRLSTMFECSAKTGPRNPVRTVKRNDSDIKLDVQFLEFEKSAIDLLHRNQFMARLSSACGEEESQAPACNIPVYAAHGQAITHSTSGHNRFSGLLRGDNEHTKHCLPDTATAHVSSVQGLQNLDFEQWLPAADSSSFLYDPQVSAAPLNSHLAKDLLDQLDLFTEPEATHYPAADIYLHTQPSGADGSVHAHCDFPYLDGYSENDGLNRSYPSLHLSQSPVDMLYNSPHTKQLSGDDSHCQWQQGLDSMVGFLPALRKPTLDTPSPPRKMSPHLLL